MVRKGVIKLTVDWRIAELAGRRLLREKVIDLGKASILGLRKEEEDPDYPEQAKAEIKHASFCTPVPCGRVIIEHAGVELLYDNLATDVEGAPNDDSLGTNSRRGYLASNNVGRRAERDLESNLDKDEKDGNRDSNVRG